MIVVAVWWLAGAHLIAVAFFPVVFRFFHPFADRGFGVALPAGMLAFGLVSWWLGVTGAIANSALTSLAVIAAIAALTWSYSLQFRRDMLVFWRRRRGLLLTEEGILIGSFFIYLWIRGFASDINGTEKFMDFAFLNAVARSDTFPPIDPWMAPSPTMPDPRVNYYYFGYLCHGLLVQMTGVAPAEGFNLSLALVFAMVAVGTFSLGYTLSRDQVATWVSGRQALAWGTPLPSGRWAPGPAIPYLVAGASTAMFTLLAGNLWTVLRWFDGSGIWDRDFWTGVGWNATRVLVIKDGDRDIDYTINEFPVFSFLLGDLHPHVLTLPFAVLAVATAYRWFVDPPHSLRRAVGVEAPLPPSLDPDMQVVPWRRLVAQVVPWASVVPVAAMLGTLYFSNSWDFPTMFGLVVLGGTVGAIRWRDEYSPPLLVTSLRIAFAAAAIAAVALIAVGPFAAGFRPPVVAGSGELPIGLVRQRSDFGQFIAFWGLQLLYLAPPLLAVTLALVGGAWTRRAWLVGGGLVAAVTVIGVAEVRSLGTYLLAVLIGTVAVVAVSRLIRIDAVQQTRMGGQSSAFPLICLAVGATLLGACEVFYIRDFYGGSLRRMNTVFKLYYQAWLLFAIAAPQLAMWTWRFIDEIHGTLKPVVRAEVSSMIAITARRGLLTWWAIVVVGMAFYPVHAVGLRTNRFAGQSIVDGMDWMRRYHPDDRAAVAWLVENAVNETEMRAPVVMEATGGAYSEFARIATQTGFPTVLGWDQHERLWRGESAAAEVERRKQDVQRFYQNGSGPDAREVLERYGVSFVVKGYLEEQAYPGRGLDELGDPGSGLIEVFRQGKTVVYATGILPRDRGAPAVAVPPIRNVR